MKLQSMHGGGADCVTDFMPTGSIEDPRPAMFLKRWFIASQKKQEALGTTAFWATRFCISYHFLSLLACHKGLTSTHGPFHLPDRHGFWKCWGWEGLLFIYLFVYPVYFTFQSQHTRALTLSWEGSEAISDSRSVLLCQTLLWRTQPSVWSSLQQVMMGNWVSERQLTQIFFLLISKCW